MKSNLAGAVNALGKAVESLGVWETEVDAKGFELAGLKARAGAEAIDNPAAAGGLADAMARLAAGQDVARLAVVSATARVEAARRAVLRERAAVLRERVVRLRSAATARQKRTDELLAALEAHEAAQYRAYVPSRDEVGRNPNPTNYRIPVTQVMFNVAKALEAKAAELLKLAEDATAQQLEYAVAEPVDTDTWIEAAMERDGSVKPAKLRQLAEAAV